MVFERGQVSSVAGSLLLDRGEGRRGQARKAPMQLTALLNDLMATTAIERLSGVN